MAAHADPPSTQTQSNGRTPAPPEDDLAAKRRRLAAQSLALLERQRAEGLKLRAKLAAIRGAAAARELAAVGQRLADVERQLTDAARAASAGEPAEETPKREDAGEQQDPSSSSSSSSLGRVAAQTDDGEEPHAVTGGAARAPATASRTWRRRLVTEPSAGAPAKRLRSDAPSEVGAAVLRKYSITATVADRAASASSRSSASGGAFAAAALRGVLGPKPAPVTEPNESRTTAAAAAPQEPPRLLPPLSSSSSSASQETAGPRVSRTASAEDVIPLCSAVAP